MHIGPDQIALEAGTIPAAAGHVYVDCSAVGLRMAPARPVFTPGRITLQAIRSCQPTFSAALAGYVEATRDDDAGKNRLCPANPYPDTAADWIASTCLSLRAQNRWLRDPDLAAWLDRSRLNAARGVRDHLDEPRMKSAVHRLLTSTEQAITNLDTLGARRATAASRQRRRIPVP